MTAFPLPTVPLADAGLRTEQIDRLIATIERQIGEARYPGCQIALARDGRLVLERSFGQARVGEQRKTADNRTLWLLYSNTKVIIASALWKLFEEGAFRFTDRVSDYLPGFAQHGKKELTVLQVITHQGGFPAAVMPIEGYSDHDKMREATCQFTLEWSPGSRVFYHGLSAHWVLASLIEALTGRDFRIYVTNAILAPLGLADDLFVGLPETEDARVSDMYEPDGDGGIRLLHEANTRVWRRAGVPGGGGYGTARGMVALYQMMLRGGELNGVRVLSPRTLAYAIRNYTGDRVDEFMGMPMHRGLGPHLRGTTATIRGMGALASPETFGHGGVGTSYCWADPQSGLSFAYITNNRVADPWHSQRLDLISNFVHSAIL
jgi:CubicO group peptidase (beta-lactamase class C family)